MMDFTTEIAFAQARAEGFEAILSNVPYTPEMLEETKTFLRETVMPYTGHTKIVIRYRGPRRGRNKYHQTDKADAVAFSVYLR